MSKSTASLRRQLLSARANLLEQIELVENPPPYKTLSRWDGRQSRIDELNDSLYEIDSALAQLDGGDDV